jgi:hypothetical protein
MGRAVCCDWTHVDICQTRRCSMSKRTAGWEFLLEDTLIGGIVSPGESYTVVAIQRARMWTRFLLKIGFLLEVVDGTAAEDGESHEERRAAGSQGREESGPREVVFIVVVAAGSQWWTPRAFLDIFAFLRIVVRVVRRSLRSRSPQQRADSGSRGGHRHLRPGAKQQRTRRCSSRQAPELELAKDSRSTTAWRPCPKVRCLLFTSSLNLNHKPTSTPPLHPPFFCSRQQHGPSESPVQIEAY